MPVTVEFPDGPREVPSRPVTITRNPIGKRYAPQYAGEEPLPIPGWRFMQALGGKWFATPVS